MVALKDCIRPMHYSGGLNLNFEPSRGRNFMSVSGLEFLEELRDHRTLILFAQLTLDSGTVACMGGVSPTLPTISS